MLAKSEKFNMDKFPRDGACEELSGEVEGLYFPSDGASKELLRAVEGLKVHVHAWSDMVSDYYHNKDAKVVDKEKQTGSSQSNLQASWKKVERRNENERLPGSYSQQGGKQQVPQPPSDTCEMQHRVRTSSTKLLLNNNQNYPSFQLPINSLNYIQDGGPESAVDAKYHISVDSDILVAPTVELPSQNKEGFKMQKDVHPAKIETCSRNGCSESYQPGNKKEYSSSMVISHANVIQPRGLVNRANWCYMNSTLQALAACSPLYNVLKTLPRCPSLQRGSSFTPILDAMIEFIHEFQPMKCGKAQGKTYVQDVTAGVPFQPTYMYEMLQQTMSRNLQFQIGRQEDAEEFLTYILNGMHEEISAVLSLINNIDNTDGVNVELTNGFIHGDGEEVEEILDEEDSSEQVEPKTISVLTRRTKIAKTPIADIFSGMLRSSVCKWSEKETANVEPFFTLQLDIQSNNVKSVPDALQALVRTEHIEGYFSNSSTKVDLFKKLCLEELPPVLILHLKSFVYTYDGGSEKLVKKVDFSVDMEISKDLLSLNARNKFKIQHRSYKLFAVVYHHGWKATGGHYTTTVFHTGINGWVDIDDSNVKTVEESQVLKYIPPRVPYLLYYRRQDSY